ncbi:MAG: hypothetical protein HYX68_04545, partial [Planctomycetes bacterium]|nr:hypothetical protein [Planctomycetota bacterium]
FLQEAFKEAFQRKFCADVLKSPDTMLHYLVKIAENKVRDQQVKYFAMQRHNLGRDKPLDAVARCERCQRPGSVTA